MYLIIGSTNPVKIAAVKRAAESIWSNVVVSGADARSDVSAQPMTDAETKQGSINRARYAINNLQVTNNNQKLAAKRKKLKTLEVRNLDLGITLGVGLEGGVFTDEQGVMWNTVWVSVTDGKRIVSANGSRFIIPENVANGIRAGEEMGVVVDRISGVDNIHHKEGFIGYMTKNSVTRTDEYANLARLALGLWVGGMVK